MPVLKKRQRDILAALRDLGGEASTREIAEKTELHVNGVSQSLGAMLDIQCLGGDGGECRWRIIEIEEINEEANDAHIITNQSSFWD